MTRTRTRSAVAVLGAVIALVAGTLMAAPAAEATVRPHAGSYNGVDHASRIVSFSFNGSQMTHFTVNGTLIGGAHVSGGAWHETCHGGMCTKGRWIRDDYVEGSWRTSSGHWTHFSATFTAVDPYVGTYMGRDSHDYRIHFSYDNGMVRSFVLGSTSFGDAHVSHGRFSFCRHGLCFRGHWQTDYYVTGQWSHEGHHTWHGWDANAYAT